MRTGENCSRNSAVLPLCALWTCIRGTAQLGLKAESCGLDKPLAFRVPGKMGCSHLPNGTRQLLNGSIISEQQLGTGRKASLSRGSHQPATRPSALVQKAQENRVQAEIQHLYYSMSNPHLPQPTGESSLGHNPQTAPQCCSLIATGLRPKAAALAQ